MKTITIDNKKYKLTLIESSDYGWRLPTMRELLTLVNYEKTDLACDLIDTENSYYWSSTTVAGVIFAAWGINFNNGKDYWSDKANTYFVRCVRPSSNGLEWSKSSTKKMTWDEAHEWVETLTDNDVYTDQQKLK